MIFKLLKGRIYVKMSGFFRDKKENDKHDKQIYKKYIYLKSFNTTSLKTIIDFTVAPLTNASARY